MEVLNAKESLDYLDAPASEREKSAVRVIHALWLERSSPLAKSELLQATTPLDLLVLYQSAAETFKNWPNGSLPREELADGQYVTNRQQAQACLDGLSDARARAAATGFANTVVRLSESSSNEQDLNYYVQLFQPIAQDQQIIDDVLSGEIDRQSKQLASLDLW